VKEMHGRYERSLTDLMAGIAVVFLLLAVIFIRKANQERQAAVDEKNQKVGKIDFEKMAVESSLIELHGRLGQLNEHMGGSFLELSAMDAGVAALEIEFKDLQFGLGKCKTPSNYQDQLRTGAVSLIREICGTVDSIRDAGAEATIILEGHTDNRRFMLRSSECGVLSPTDQLRFQNNVRASAARAQEVFFTIRDELADAGYERRCLDENFVVSGRGEAAPRPKTEASDQSNRRLVIRVRGDLRLQ